MYLIDSDWLIDYLADTTDAVLLIEPLVSKGVAFSIISYLEAFEGTLRARDTIVAQQELALALSPFEVHPIREGTARVCARIRYDLRSRGRRVRDRALDLMIAATAIEHDLTLVTRNLRDFGDILGLRIYAQRSV